MVGRVRVNEITAPDGLSAVAAPYGVKFNNNVSSDANTLDWYEEGVIVPTITGAISAGSCTYQVQFGNFTRIGRMVQYSLRIAWTGHTGTGQLRINGFPYASSTMNVDSAECAAVMSRNYVDTMVWFGNGVNYASGHTNVTSGSWTAAVIVAAGELIVNGQYKV